MFKTKLKESFKHIISFRIDTFVLSIIFYIHIRLPDKIIEVTDFYSFNLISNLTFILTFLYLGVLSSLMLKNKTFGESIWLKGKDLLNINQKQYSKYTFINIINVYFYNLLNYFLKITLIKPLLWLVKQFKEKSEIV